jgi:predicted O-methyltransferase YrrM
MKLKTGKSLLKNILIKIAADSLPDFILRDKAFFQAMECKGYHVTPVHFYEPIPDTRELSQNFWTIKSELIGIEMNLDEQILLLNSFGRKYRTEIESFMTDENKNPDQFHFNNGAFESVDAEVLYCMIREKKPKNIYEIGAGFSSLIISEAIAANKNENQEYRCTYYSIDPFPPSFIKNDLANRHELIIKKVQDIPVSLFQDLGNNDILFIDSSHVAKIESDVNYEILEILPRLNKGVIIHFHDILLPYEYSKEIILDNRCYWNEQYLLQAFLIFNKNFKILFAGNYIHNERPDILEDIFNSYKNNSPTGRKSFWIQRITD